jgi:hypothetical protein
VLNIPNVELVHLIFHLYQDQVFSLLIRLAHIQGIGESYILLS